MITDNQVRRTIEAIKASADPDRLGMYHHPLYVGFPLPEVTTKAPEGFMDVFNLERIVRHKLEGIERALNRRDFWQVVMFHTERPYRLHKFWELLEQGYLDPDTKEYSHLLADVWIDCEHPHINRPVWLAAFEAADRMHMLTGDDRKLYDKLFAKAEPPLQHLKIYRGTDKSELDDFTPYGMSWTLSKDTALWFARRWATQKEQPPVLLEAEVGLSSVYGPFTSRGEDEIVVTKSHTLLDLKETILEDD